MIFPCVPVLLMVILFVLYVALSWVCKLDYTSALTWDLGRHHVAYLIQFLGSVHLRQITRRVGFHAPVHRRFSSRPDRLLSYAHYHALERLEPCSRGWQHGLGLSMASIFPTFLMLAGERMEVTAP